LIFSLDENIHAALASQLRQRGIDAYNAYDLHQEGWTDAALLQEAATQERVLVTHNISHFVTLHRSYLAEGRSHAWIVVTPVRPIGTLLTRLIALQETTTAEEMASTLRFL
jgi:predicted nuclease of predicted toxin-antitoxin system